MALNRYFDNAATSFPKPREVSQRMGRFIEHEGGTYGRSAYPRVIEATAEVEAVRDQLAQLIGAPKAEQVVFTANATDAINMVVHGLALSGRILTTPLEHHAVTRPLYARGCRCESLPALSDGRIDVDHLYQVDTKDVRLMVINAVSNVNGVIQPLNEVAQWAKNRKIAWAIDAAQAAGVIPINVKTLGCDYLFLTAHKALLGPQGVGALYIKDPKTLAPWRQGGSGTGSQSAEMPAFSPERYEAGTPNIVGILGLGAALKHRPEPKHSRETFIAWKNELMRIPRLRWLCANEDEYQSELISFVPLKLPVDICTSTLIERYQIELRSGWHCATMAHQFLGSQTQGSIRLSLSPYHRKADLDYVLKALQECFLTC